MQWKLLADNAETTWALIFETGDEVLSLLTKFAKVKGFEGSRFTAIGGFSDVTLGYFDWERKEYDRIPIREQVEVLSFIGDIALNRGEPQVHAHVVLGDRNGMARGGHLLEAHVRPTLEVILTETPRHLVRKYDQETGLPLISPLASDPRTAIEPTENDLH